MTDVIADLFTRIRNGLMVKKDSITLDYSIMKESILKLLVKQGFLSSYKILSKQNSVKKSLEVILKYDDNGAPLISQIKRVSTPGNRVYVNKKDIPKVLSGFGICILSTNQGVITGRNARKLNCGGELLGIVH